MATHVWTGATNTSYNNAGNWTGGIPTAGGDVTFSGSVNCVVDVATAALNSWDMTGYTGILSSTGNIRIDNSADAVCKFAGGTHTWSGQLLLNPASTRTLSLTSAGKLGACTALTINGVGTVSLQDDLTIAATAILTLSAGTFTTNNYNVDCVRVTSSGTVTRTFNLGTSIITCRQTSGSGWLNDNSNGITVTDSAYEIRLVGSGVNLNFATNLRKVVFSGGGVCSITESASSRTIAELTYTGTAIQTCQLTLNSSQTLNISTSLILTGNSDVNRLLIVSSAIGTARTIALGASATCASVSNYVDFQDITLSGGAANERDFQTNSKSAGDCGGNTGITFTTAAEQTWSGATGNWSNSALWTSRIPLPQDNVVIGVPTTPTYTDLVADMPRLGKDITFTNNNAAKVILLRLNYQTNTVYGSVTFVTSDYMRITNNQTFVFAGRGSHTYTSAGLMLYNPIFDTYGGSISQLDAANYSYLYIKSGTYNTGNYNITTQFIKGTGTLNKTINLGTSNIVVSSSGGVDFSPTNTTVNDSGSTINLTYTGASATTFAGGTSTYNDIVITPGTGILTFSGAFTFNNMTMASAGAKTIKFTSGTTYTMTGTNFFTGNSTAPTTTAIVSGDTLNGNFETATGNDFANWTETVGGTSTITAETTDIHSGSQCIKLTVDGTNSQADIRQSVLTAGKIYKITLWAKVDSISGSPKITIGDTVSYFSYDLTTTWTQYTQYWICGNAPLWITRGANCANRTILVDDVLVENITGLLLVPTTNRSIFTINKTSGTISTDNIYLQDCTVSGGLTAAYAGANSIDGSGNTGWTFTAPPSDSSFGWLKVTTRYQLVSSPFGGIRR